MVKQLEKELPLVKKKGGGRIVFLDVIRIIACFLVIVNHTNSPIFKENEMSLRWLFAIGYFFLCKIAVPLFLLVSGYTMLSKKDGYKKTLIKFAKFSLSLVIVSFVYYLWKISEGVVETFTVKAFLRSLFASPASNALWYMYMYLGLILMLPFIQRMVSAFEKKDYHMFFLLSLFILSLWPILVHYFPDLSYTPYFTVPLFDSYICLVIAGHYIKKYTVPSKKSGFVCLLVFVATWAFNVICTCIEYKKLSGVGYLFFDNVKHLPIMVGSVCVFYFISTLDFSEKAGRIACIIGSTTFGVYLISDLLIEKLYFVFVNQTAAGVHPTIAMFVYQIAVFVGGVLFIYILRKIPFVKKLI